MEAAARSFSGRSAAVGRVVLSGRCGGVLRLRVDFVHWIVRLVAELPLDGGGFGVAESTPCVAGERGAVAAGARECITWKS